jgi:hypothetical protein
LERHGRAESKGESGEGGFPELTRGASERSKRRYREQLLLDVGALLAWANSYLRARNLRARTLVGEIPPDASPTDREVVCRGADDDLESDFHSGVLLCHLLEIAYADEQPTLTRRFCDSAGRPVRKKLSSRIAQVDNALAPAVAFLRERRHLELEPHVAQDLAERKLRACVRTLHRVSEDLARRVVAQGFEGEAETRRSGRARGDAPSDDWLLNWVRRALADPSNAVLRQPRVDDYGASFADGLAFAGVVNFLAPGALELGAVVRAGLAHARGASDAARQLADTEARQLAFGAAERALAVPSPLAAEHFAPDAVRSVETASLVQSYLKLLISATRAPQAQAAAVAELAAASPPVAAVAAAADAEAHAPKAAPSGSAPPKSAPFGDVSVAASPAPVAAVAPPRRKRTSASASPLDLLELQLARLRRIVLAAVLMCALFAVAELFPWDWKFATT